MKRDFLNELWYNLSKAISLILVISDIFLLFACLVSGIWFTWLLLVLSCIATIIAFSAKRYFRKQTFDPRFDRDRQRERTTRYETTYINKTRRWF